MIQSIIFQGKKSEGNSYANGHKGIWSGEPGFAMAVTADIGSLLGFEVIG
jgi:hypothetical protein